MAHAREQRATKDHGGGDAGGLRQRHHAGGINRRDSLLRLR